MRKTSYDSRVSFQGSPEKVLLPAGTQLYRLLNIGNGPYFDSVSWIPEPVFWELHDDANGSAHGGRLFRNYVAQFMALPSGATQLSVVEIQLNPGYMRGRGGRRHCLAGRAGWNRCTCPTSQTEAARGRAHVRG